jgi:hypothetical protein
VSVATWCSRTNLTSAIGSRLYVCIDISGSSFTAYELYRSKRRPNMVSVARWLQEPNLTSIGSRLSVSCEVQTPLVRFFCGFAVDFLWICCGFFVDLLYNLMYFLPANCFVWAIVRANLSICLISSGLLVRFVMDLSHIKLYRKQQIQVEFELKCYTEIFRIALTVYEWYNIILKIDRKRSRPLGGAMTSSIDSRHSVHSHCYIDISGLYLINYEYTFDS